MKQYQQTIKKPCTFKGIGVHSGSYVEVELLPASAGTGLVFISAISGAEPIKIGSIVPEKAMHATVLKSKTWAISTVEHLMAALMWCGIDNGYLRVVGGEIPIFDGSALPFVQAFQEIGVVEQPMHRLKMRPRERLEFADDQGRSIVVEPWSQDQEDFQIEYQALFDHPLVGHSTIAHRITSDFFIQELAPARTFGFINQLPRLRAYNLARGTSLGNTVVFSDNECLSSMRYADECVRHKLLDLIGDLALLGHPIVAKMCAKKTGHSFNRMIIEDYIARPERWELFE